MNNIKYHALELFRKIIIICLCVLTPLLLWAKEPGSHESNPQEADAKSENKPKITQSPAALKKERELKTRIRQYQQLLEIYQSSGYSEDEIKSLNLEYQGEKINVYEFLEKEKEKEKKAEEEKMMAEKKRYFSVLDITEEMMKTEPKKLSKLRDSLILTGE